MTLFQIINPVLDGPLSGRTGDGLTNTGTIISSIIGLFLVLASIAALLYIIIGGIGWVISDGDKNKLEQSRNRILQAIIGLIIVASAWAIWILFGKFLGINFDKMPFPTLGG